MGFDGSIKIDTKLDTSGIKTGLGKMVSGIKTGMKAATAAAAAGAAACVKVGADFESAMALVAATMGIEQVGEDFEKLSRAAEEAGATTKYSAAEAAEALNYLALAGYSAEKSAAALPVVLDLAAAGGLELGYASDVVTDAMSALGVECEELTGFVDEMARTSQKSNTNIAQLGEGILTVGATARDLAGGTVELSTVLGILADNGIKGAEGGTALRNMILSLSAPTDKAAELMDGLGLAVFDANGKLRPLNEVFCDLDDILSELTDKEKINVLNTIFNKVDLKSANAFLANCGQRFDELSGYISNSDGAARAMSKTMNDNLKGQIEELSSAAEGLGIAVYEGIENPIKSAVATATDKIGDLAQSVSGGELNRAVGAVGSLLGNVLNIAVDVADTAIPMLIKGLSHLSQHSDAVNLSLMTSAAAFGTWKSGIIQTIPKISAWWGSAKSALAEYNAAVAVCEATSASGATVQMLLAKSLSAGQLAVGVLTGKVTLATAATVAWNAVTSISVASVLGVVGAVAALAAAIGVLYAKQQAQQLQTVKDTELCQKRTEALKEEISERKKLEETRRQSAQSALTEISNSERLWSELGRLADENGRVNEQNRARANFIAGELSEALGVEIQLVDGQIQKYGELCGSINEMIAAKKAQIFLESEEENYKNALIAIQKEESEQVGAAILVEYRAQKARELSIELLKAQAEAAEATSRSEKKAAEKRAESLRALYDEQMVLYNSAAEEYRLREADIKEHYETVGRYEDAATAMTEKNYGKVIDIISSQYPGAMHTAEDLAGKSFEEQQRMLEDDAKRSELLALQKRERLNAQYAGMTEDMVTAAEKTAQEAAEKWHEVGGCIVSGTAEGIDAGEGGLKDKIAQMAQNALSAAKAALGIHSPSRVMRDEVGRYIAEGIAVGIDDYEYKVSDAFENMLDNLELRRDMGVISEEEYYEQLERLRDEHIKKGTADWWKYTKEIIKYKQDAESEAQERELSDLKRLREREMITDEQYYRRLLEYRNKYFEDGSEQWREYTDEIADYVESEKNKIIDSYDELTDALGGKIEDMADKLSDTGDLYDKIKATYKSAASGEEYTIESIHLHDFEDDIALMSEYADAVEAVKKRGVPTEFFDILRGMDIESGLELAKALNKATDEEFKKYTDGWQKKEEAAERLAGQLYADEVTEIKEKYLNDLREFYDDVPEDFFDCGIKSGNAFGEALAGSVSAAMERVKNIINSFGISFGGAISSVMSAAGGTGSSVRTTSYNFYGSGQTVSEQLAAARAADTVNKLRGE